MTNLPIISAFFHGHGEIVLTLDTHIMALRVRRKTGQNFEMEQIHSRHLRMAPGGGRVSASGKMVPLVGYEDGKERLYLALRSEKNLEIVGTKIEVTVSERCTAFHHSPGGCNIEGGRMRRNGSTNGEEENG